MYNRRKSRENAMQCIFMCDFVEEWNQGETDLFISQFSIPSYCRTYALTIIQGVIDKLAFIDSKIMHASTHWSIQRMNRVDRAILRVAVYELYFQQEIPPKVIINEAIEIAKRYGSENSPMFVNGVLDHLAKANDDVGHLSGGSLSTDQQKIPSKITVN